MRKKCVAIIVPIAASCVTTAVLSGCGGGNDFGFDVSIPQSRHHNIDRPAGAAGSVILAPDRPFNVIDAQRRSEGLATATSRAAPDGSASCVADASRGGSAVAGFQVGHVVAYHGSAQFDATVVFDVTYACELEAYETRYGDAPIRLRAYVMDSNRQVLGQVMLATSDADRLPARWAGSQAPSFHVTFEPGLAYHLIVAGQVEVSGSDTSGPTASLSVTKVDIRVIPAPG